MDDGVADEGYIKLYRALQGSEVWAWPPRYLKLWVYLLLEARWAPQSVAGLSVSRGQVVKSYSQIQKDNEWVENRGVRRWSKSQIKRMVDRLVEAGMVTTSETELGTLFRIRNFEKYQGLTLPASPNLEQLRNGTAERDSGTTAERGQVVLRQGLADAATQNLERKCGTTWNHNKKVEEGVKYSLSLREPPQIRDLYLQEMVQKHGVDLELEWSGFRSYVEANGRRYDNVQKAWHGWLVREIRQRESRPQRVNHRTGSKKPWED